MILAYVFVHRAKGLVSLIAVVAASGAFVAVGFDVIREPVTDVVESRITGRVDRLGYEGLYGERTKIYFENFPRALEKAPWVLLTGSGFQNISVYMGGVTGGHNNYLHVLMELGVVGLSVYLIFLFRILRTQRRAAAAATTQFQYFAASDALIGFVGVLATMLVGETLWAQYSMFTLSGQIMAYMAIASAPFFWLPSAGKVPIGAKT
jgi:O-antigen ligase